MATMRVSATCIGAACVAAALVGLVVPTSARARDVEMTGTIDSPETRSAVFGWELDTDGNLAIVTGPAADYERGAAYALVRQGSGSAWTLVKKFSYGSEYFGMAVAFDGDTVLVGEGFNNPEPSTLHPGYVRVFERNEGGADNWGYVRTLAAWNRGADDFNSFGTRIDISGDIAISNAYYELPPGDPIGGPDYWATCVFMRDAGGANHWDQVAEFPPSENAYPDRLSSVAAITGDTVVCGGTQSTSSSVGIAYVFQRDQGGPDAWGLVTKLLPSGPGGNGRFGAYIDAWEDTLFIGAPYNDAAGADAGAVFVFERNAGGPNAWGQVACLTASDSAPNAHFGSYFTMRGDVALIASETGEPHRYKLHVFRRNTGMPATWTEAGHLMAPDGSYSFELRPMAVAGDIALRGDVDSERVEVYRLSCTGDFDGDWDASVSDFVIFAAEFGTVGLDPYEGCDLDGDGDVDVFDFAIFAAHFGCAR